MRALGWFLAAIFGTLVAAALLAWPAWQLAQAIEPDWPFHRVVSRLWQLLQLIGLVLAVRRLGLRGRADWGYGLPRGAFLRQALAGLGLGVATMLPVTLAMLSLGLRSGAGVPAAAFVEAAAAGLVTGLVVSLLEETFFRGLMYTAIAREQGVGLAAVATATVYSAVHFLASVRIPADAVTPASGLALLGGALSNFAQPAAIADSFVTLLVVGLVLALVRARTGAIAACLGLHAGWVAVIQATSDLTGRVPGSRWAWLLGTYDDYTGWMTAAWGALLAAAAWRAGWLRPAAR